LGEGFATTHCTPVLGQSRSRFAKRRLEELAVFRLKGIEAHLLKRRHRPRKSSAQIGLMSLGHALIVGPPPERGSSTLLR
jgi:hypothetical protein